MTMGQSWILYHTVITQHPRLAEQLLSRNLTLDEQLEKKYGKTSIAFHQTSAEGNHMTTLNFQEWEDSHFWREGTGLGLNSFLEFGSVST